MTALCERSERDLMFLSKGVFSIISINSLFLFTFGTFAFQITRNYQRGMAIIAHKRYMKDAHIYSNQGSLKCQDDYFKFCQCKFAI
jgi:hypothetical protein